MIEGVILTPLKKVLLDKGDVLHGIKSTDETYYGFGEAYFSVANYLAIKGWKKHTKMNMNLVVPAGAIKFVIFDDRTNSSTAGCFFTVELSEKNYARLTVPAGVWVAFQGTGQERNLLMNFADLVHDPSEAQTKEIDLIPYNWD